MDWLPTIINVLRRATDYLHVLLLMLLGAMLGLLLGAFLNMGWFGLGAGALLGLWLGFWLGKKIFANHNEPVLVMQEALPSDVWESVKVTREFSLRRILAQAFSLLYVFGFVAVLLGAMMRRNNWLPLLGVSWQRWFVFGLGLCVLGLPALYFGVAQIATKMWEGVGIPQFARTAM